MTAAGPRFELADSTWTPGMTTQGSRGRVEQFVSPRTRRLRPSLAATRALSGLRAGARTVGVESPDYIGTTLPLQTVPGTGEMGSLDPTPFWRGHRVQSCLWPYADRSSCRRTRHGQSSGHAVPVARSESPCNSGGLRFDYLSASRSANVKSLCTPPACTAVHKPVDVLDEFPNP